MRKHEKIFLCALAGCLLAVAAHNRISLLDKLSGFKKMKARTELASEFKKSAPDCPWIKGTVKDFKIVKEDFNKTLSLGESFQRGEIENPENLNLFTEFLELNILFCRSNLRNSCDEKGAPVGSCSEDLATWFNFVADMTYDESTLVALRWARVVRSLWLDELEWVAKEQPQKLVPLKSKIDVLRAPWPMDRILVSESARLKSQRGRDLFIKVAKAIQKNPYQNMDQILGHLSAHAKLGTGEEQGFLRQMWKDEDLLALKQEVHRIAFLQVRAAQAAYVEKNHSEAKNFADLVDAKLIPSVPIDYLTGKPMEYPK